MSVQQERDFIHEMANLLAFSSGQVAMLERKVKKCLTSNDTPDLGEILEDCSKIRGGAKKVEECLRRRRNEIREEMSQSENSSDPS